MAVRVSIRLKSIEDHIKKRHGKIRNPTPGEKARIQYWANRVIEYIKANWPVDTGTSRDRWVHEMSAINGQVILNIENPMFYSEYVHRSGGTAEDPLWERLVPEAWGIFKDQLISETQMEIDGTERELDRRTRAGARRSEGLMDIIRNPNLVDIFGEIFGV